MYVIKLAALDVFYADYLSQGWKSNTHFWYPFTISLNTTYASLKCLSCVPEADIPLPKKPKQEIYVELEFLLKFGQEVLTTESHIVLTSISSSISTFIWKLFYYYYSVYN